MRIKFSDQKLLQVMMGVFKSAVEFVQTQASFKFKFERFGLNLRLVAKQAVNLQNFIDQSRVNLLGLNFTRSGDLIEIPRY